MANRRRGEAAIDLGGRRHILRLTLNALAEMEAAFGAAGLSDLGARLSSDRLRAADLVVLLGGALRGGGADLSDEAVGDLVEAADLPRIAEALGTLFLLNFGERSQDRPSKGQPDAVPGLRPSHGTR